MAGIEEITGLDEIMKQHQMERSVEGTTVMKFGAEGPEPLCPHIAQVFAQAAKDPSMDITRDMNNIPTQGM